MENVKVPPGKDSYFTHEMPLFTDLYLHALFCAFQAFSSSLYSTDRAAAFFALPDLGRKYRSCDIYKQLQDTVNERLAIAETNLVNWNEQ